MSGSTPAAAARGDIGQRFATTGARSSQDVTRPADTRADDAIANTRQNGQDPEPAERAITDEAPRHQRRVSDHH